MASPVAPPSPRPMTRYALAVGGALILCALAVMALVMLADFEPSSGVGTGTSIASIIVGVMWFARDADRPMMPDERMTFAVGVVLVNMVLTIGYALLAVVLAGMPISASSIDVLLMGGKGYLFEGAFIGLMLFMLLLTFAEAYGLAWGITRGLPRKRKAGGAPPE